MCRRISAASVSPSVSSRMAARSTPERFGNAGAAGALGAAGLAAAPFAPVFAPPFAGAPFFAAASAIGRHPGHHGLRDPFRILRDQAARLRHLLFVSETLTFAAGATARQQVAAAADRAQELRLLAG